MLTPQYNAGSAASEADGVLGQLIGQVHAEGRSRANSLEAYADSRRLHPVLPIDIICAVCHAQAMPSRCIGHYNKDWPIAS